MIKALREAAAKVPVPKKDKMASPSRGTPLAAPAGGAAQQERGQLFHNARCFYLNTITLLQDISRLPLCSFLSPLAGRRSQPRLILFATAQMRADLAQAEALEGFFRRWEKHSSPRRD